MLEEEARRKIGSTQYLCLMDFGRKPINLAIKVYVNTEAQASLLGDEYCNECEVPTCFLMEVSLAEPGGIT